MAKTTIIVNITANPDKIDLIKKELTKLVDKTRAEKGCINYDLHQDNENPAHFMFYENWESRKLWLTHMNSHHVEDYIRETEGSVAGFTFNEMTHIS